MRSVVASPADLPSLAIPGATTGERARLITSTLPHYVYTVWDDKGRPLYVGCTRNVRHRMGQHRRSGVEWYARMAKVTKTAHPNRAEGRKAEAERIRELLPEVNLYHNPRHSPRNKRRTA